MRFVVQVCKEASVTIDNEVIARISKGEVVLVSFTNGDDEKIVDKMIDKLIKLRILETCPTTVRETADALANSTDSDVVQVIGTRFILYKESKNNKTIKLVK